MKRSFMSFAFFLVLTLIFSGCTKSFNFSYQADAALSPNAAELQKYSVSIAKFEDKRVWVEKGNSKSESFVGHHGPWKFGVTYKENDYTPINEIVQDLLMQELAKAGFKVKVIDKVVSKDSLQSSNEIISDQASDYILGGQLLAFEFANKEGWWTITSSRTVTINLNFFRTNDMQLLIDTTLHETENQVYGMGVAHSINIYNLMNNVFKKVAQRVALITSEKIGSTQVEGKK